MKIYGVVITAEQQAAVVSLMAANRVFMAGDVEIWLQRNGVPDRVDRKPIAYRGADRLIQQQRKAGNITYENKRWRWVGA